jgi:hypothetical protein
VQQGLADSLHARRAALVLPDQAWMPAPLEAVREIDPVAGPFACVRLLGDRNAVGALTRTLDPVVIDRAEQIKADAEAIPQQSGRVPVLGSVNNHFAGHASPRSNSCGRRWGCPADLAAQALPVVPCSRLELSPGSAVRRPTSPTQLPWTG